MRGSPRKKRASRRSRNSGRASCRGCRPRANAAGRALVSLETESKNRARELARLKDQQGGLEKLVRELRRALERIDKFPTDSKDAFAKLRGKLAWPVAGKLLASFGQTRAGGVKWDGVLVSGSQGAAVRAVYHGRVVYADWLSGLGLLTIIDHGDGYLSLYGHNERLYKEVGERVTAGDTIATVGDSGGRLDPRAVLRNPQGGPAGRPAALVQERVALRVDGKNANCINAMQTDIRRWSRVDDLRKLHGAVRAAGALAVAAGRLGEPVRQQRQAPVEQRGQHQPRPVRAGAPGHRAHRGPASKTGDGVGQHCALADDGPAYLFWLRDAERQCRRHRRRGLQPAQGRCRRVAVLLCPRSPEARARAAAPRPAGARRHRHAQRVADRARQGPGAAAVGHRQSSAGERRRRSAKPAGQRRRPPEVRARRHRRARQGPGAHASRKPATPPSSRARRSSC